VEPGETFTDEEMIVALARAIEDLIFKEIYGFNIPYEVRLVLDTLAYACRRLPIIKHSKKIKPTKGKVTKGISRKMVADATDKSRATHRLGDRKGAVQRSALARSANRSGALVRSRAKKKIPNGAAARSL
jgi:hypothetical protein